MRNRSTALIVGLLAALLWPSAGLAEPTYESGTLLEVRKKVELTPASWLWDTVVTYHEMVRYELRIQVGDEIYTTEYVPLIQPTGPLPTEWKTDAPVEVRVTKHELLIKLSYDGEVETHLVRRVRLKSP
jgi:hypothetical protein